ncbi:hypothetical protein AX774_g773 [Zancudomyces culisetae]|uniref:Uncharacterized protein n=1 Tax=Zancudomyces culisetae TaxID=1213189 RepID=A0A1R1PXJ8_ZANCU|nr:hypothetical protein AX774_g773 [Zancudomyces culisetae]|eukprot:OMH85662.1 hypothetical protein AX774_g773 [Zancudomyces culisetae]
MFSIAKYAILVKLAITVTSAADVDKREVGLAPLGNIRLPAVKIVDLDEGALFNSCVAKRGYGIFLDSDGCTKCYCGRTGVYCPKKGSCKPSESKENKNKSFGDISLESWIKYNACALTNGYGVFNSTNNLSMCYCTIDGMVCGTIKASKQADRQEKASIESVTSTQALEKYSKCVKVHGEKFFYKSDGCTLCICTVRGTVCYANGCKNKVSTLKTVVLHKTASEADHKSSKASTSTQKTQQVSQAQKSSKSDKSQQSSESDQSKISQKANQTHESSEAHTSQHSQNSAKAKADVNTTVKVVANLIDVETRDLNDMLTSTLTLRPISTVAGDQTVQSFAAIGTDSNVLSVPTVTDSAASAKEINRTHLLKYVIFAILPLVAQIYF